MSRPLFLEILAVLFIAGGGICARLVLKAMGNFSLPSDPLPDTEHSGSVHLRALPLAGFSVRTLLGNPALMWFATLTTAALLVLTFWFAPPPVRCWLLRGESVSTIPMSGLKDPRILVAVVASQAADSFLSTWVRVAVAIAVLAILRNGSWNIGAVLGRLRERGMAITAFAVMFALSDMPADIPGHLEGVSNHLLQLVLRACTFPLILGPAVLADENIGGTAAVWRSARLLLRAWPTRLRGYFLVMSPLFVVLGVAAGIREAIQLGHPLGSGPIDLAWSAFGLLSGIPALTVVAAFDTVLYTRVEQSRSKESPAAAPSPSLPSPA